MATWKEILQSEGLLVSDLDKDTQDWIKEYEKIEKSKLPAVRDKATGQLTPGAISKMNRINKAICDGIADVAVERDEKQDIEKKKADEAEAARLAAEEAEKQKKPADPVPADPVKEQSFFEWLGF
jgi:Zn-finger domain-containing protein